MWQGLGNLFDRPILLFRQIEAAMLRQHAIQNGMGTGGVRSFIQIECARELGSMVSKLPGDLGMERECKASFTS